MRGRSGQQGTPKQCDALDQVPPRSSWRATWRRDVSASEGLQLLIGVRHGWAVSKRG